MQMPDMAACDGEEDEFRDRRAQSAAALNDERMMIEEEETRMMMDWSNCFWTHIRAPCCLPILGGWITAACPSLIREANKWIGRTTYGDVLRGSFD